MRLEKLWGALLAGLLLGAVVGCAGDDDDDDTSADDDDTSADDDDSGDDDSSSIEDDDDSASPLVDADGDGHDEDIDCNDNDAAIHPGADELCDNIDNDCDGAVDESDAQGAPTWYEDSDGDGYGDDSSASVACNQPHGYAAHGGDCNDADPRYHPGATESDCTDPADYNCDGSVGYADLDNDGEAACEDCDDNNAAVHSTAIETCNSIDDDCDGQADEAGATGETTWYLDADADGYGRSTLSQVSCNQPLGYVNNANDCDDLNANSFPGGAEVCDGIDNNCSGGIDEGAAAPVTWYADFDGDGIGNASNSLVACAAPPGYVSASGDCDDLDASAFPAGVNSPAATEVCDGTDNNCDLSIDEGVTSTFYGDADGDGYGDPGTLLVACFLPAGASSNNQDCNDGQASVHPGGFELCDGFDNDCDGSADNGAFDATTWYVDNDGDNYGDPLTGTTSCSQTTGTVSNNLDCNDDDADNYPGAIEICDGNDENCNNAIDEGHDLDGDGITSCGIDGISSSADDDCDDADPQVYPGNTELCDAQDNNCDSNIDEGFDSDSDTFTSCGPDGIPGNSDDDCNDGDPGINPSSSEICDAQDQDCNGVIDNGFDSDNDGTTTCGPDGTAGTNDDDCDDTVAGPVLNGMTAFCPAQSCLAIRDGGWSTGDGSYWLAPGGSAPFEGYCDMSDDDGGWTLVSVGGDNHGLVMIPAAMGQPSQIVRSDPGVDVIHKLSDTVINQIKQDNGNAIGIRIIFESNGLKKFGRSNCTWESDSRNPANSDCDFATGSYSTNPSWDGPHSNYWFSGGLPSWSAGGCPSWQRMGIYSSAYSNNQNSYYHVGACGMDSWGTLWVR